MEIVLEIGQFQQVIADVDLGTLFHESVNCVWFFRFAQQELLADSETMRS
jgi:hypothetical protein